MQSKHFKNNLNIAVNLIKKSHNIILACHVNPDGDALGSMLALGLGLKKLGKHVVMLCPDKVPYRYHSLPGSRHVKQRYKNSAQLAITIDCGSMNQLSSIERIIEQSSRIIEIDHHEYRTRFGDIQIVDKGVVAVGQIVYIILNNLKVSIDKKIAECLITSALVETSSFSHQEVNTSIFDFCSALMRLGINFHKISERYYWIKKISCSRLSGLCLSRIQTREGGRLVWSIIRKKDFDEFKGSKEDVDAVPDEMMLVENAEIALLFREIENNMLRVSLRSKKKIDIGYLASIHGGGGHHNVAGCRIHNNKRTIDRFIKQACNLLGPKSRKANS